MIPISFIKAQNNLGCDNTVLVIGHQPVRDVQSLFKTYPEVSIWVLSDNRESTLAAIRAGACNALCTDIHDIQGINKWLGVKTFDIITASDFTSYEALQVIAASTGPHLNPTGRLILCGASDETSVKLQGDELISAEESPELKLVVFHRGQKLRNHTHSLRGPESSPSYSSTKVDVVLPLSCESRYNNDELRICLRSIDKFLPNVGTVWLITEFAPSWLKNVQVIAVPDKHKHNKDANLFDKLLSAAIDPRVASTFLFFSDDQCLINMLNTETMKTVFNERGPKSFSSAGTWHKRMTNTYQYLGQRGISMSVNFDGHVPMKYTKTEFIKALAGVDYVPPPGFCINTLVCGLLGKVPEIKQNSVKITAEGAWAGTITQDKLYVGYNDTGFGSGMRTTLFRLFPDKSRYEA